MPEVKIYNQRTDQLEDGPIALELEQAIAQLAAATFKAIVKDEWLLGYIFDDAHRRIVVRVSRGDGEFYQSFDDGKIRLIKHLCTTRKGADGAMYPVQDAEPIQKFCDTFEVAEKSLADFILEAINKQQHTLIEIRSERGNIRAFQHLVGLVEVNPFVLNHTDNLALAEMGNIEDFKYWAAMADMMLKLIEPIPTVVDSPITSTETTIGSNSSDNDGEGSSYNLLNLGAEVEANRLVYFSVGDRRN